MNNVFIYADGTINKNEKDFDFKGVKEFLKFEIAEKLSFTTTIDSVDYNVDMILDEDGIGKELPHNVMASIISGCHIVGNVYCVFGDENINKFWGEKIY